MTRWSFVLADTDGAAVAEVTDARGRSFTRSLAGADSASVSLSGRSDVGRLVGEGFDQDLLVYRDGVLLFRGRIGAPQDSMDADSHEVSIEAVGYRELLSMRHLEADVSFTSVEQEQIGWDLIDAVQTLSGGDLGITREGTATGVARSRAFEVGAEVEATIDGVAEADGGFDWDVTPELVYTVWYPGRGSTLDRVLHYSESGGNVRSLRRQPDVGRYATVVVATTNDEEIDAQSAVASDVAAQGRWTHVEGVSDADSTSTLQEVADGLLADRESLRAAWTAELVSWGGPEDFDVGDVVRLVVQSGRFDTERLLRVQEIGVAIDDSDVETVTVDVDRPRPDLARALRRTSRRVTDLER